MATILCMKWGHAYDVDYVNILYRAVCDHMEMDFRFVCLTDDASGLDAGIEVRAIPDMGIDARHKVRGCWPKLCVFAPELHDIKGRVLFLDVDIVLTGQLDIFFDPSFSEGLWIIREWGALGNMFRRRGRRPEDFGNSSVFAFDIGSQTQIYEAFMSDQAGAYAGYRNEQRFLVAQVRELNFWPLSLCLSFKKDLMRTMPFNFIIPPRRVPEDARVIVFHGKPNPKEVGQDYWWGPDFRRGFMPVGWVRDYWQKYSRSDRQDKP